MFAVLFQTLGLYMKGAAVRSTSKHRAAKVFKFSPAKATITTSTAGHKRYDDP
jgi:hypothetical protein